MPAGHRPALEDAPPTQEGREPAPISQTSICFLKPALQTAKDEHLLLSPLNGLTPALVLVLADGQRLPQPMEDCCLYHAPIQQPDGSTAWLLPVSVNRVWWQLLSKDRGAH